MCTSLLRLEMTEIAALRASSPQVIYMYQVIGIVMYKQAPPPPPSPSLTLLPSDCARLEMSLQH